MQALKCTKWLIKRRARRLKRLKGATLTSRRLWPIAALSAQRSRCSDGTLARYNAARLRLLRLRLRIRIMPRNRCLRARNAPHISWRCGVARRGEHRRNTWITLRMLTTAAYWISTDAYASSRSAIPCNTSPTLITTIRNFVNDDARRRRRS